MRCLPVRVVGSTLIALLVVSPAAGHRAMANDMEPTAFHRAISAWMGVVTLLAEDGDATSKEQSEGEAKRGDTERSNREHAMRGDRGGREGRGPREWSRDRGPGPRGPGMRMQGPPMHGMHGMPGMPGMPYMGPGSTTKLDEIAERLARIERKLDAAPRMGNPWSPRPEAGARPGFAGPGFSRGREMPEEMRKRMTETREKMEQARRRFAEMEERIKKLEAEVERLKAGK